MRAKKTAKEIHGEWCALMVERARKPKRNRAVGGTAVVKSNPQVKTSGLSKAMLASQLYAAMR